MSFFVAFLMVSANAAADPAATAPVQDSAVVAPAVPEKPKKQKLICKSDDADSGSHMARRICRTAQQWNNVPEADNSHSGFSIRGEMMQGH